MAWDGEATHDPWRIVTDQPAEGQTLTEYALRMGIDLGFLDDILDKVINCDFDKLT